MLEFHDKKIGQISKIKVVMKWKRTKEKIPTYQPKKGRQEKPI